MLNLNRLQILISGLGPKAETQSDNKTLKVLARKESTTGIFGEEFSERQKEQYQNTECTKIGPMWFRIWKDSKKMVHYISLKG